MNETAAHQNAGRASDGDGPLSAGEERVLRVCVLNEQGLHARPAAKLAKEAQKFASTITLAADEAEANAKSILDILTLAAGQGENLELRATGVDAEAALDALAEQFKNRFR